MSYHLSLSTKIHSVKKRLKQFLNVFSPCHGKKTLMNVFDNINTQQLRNKNNNEICSVFCALSTKVFSSRSYSTYSECQLFESQAIKPIQR